jgi:uncharacterized protein (DUF302 family)
MSESSDSVPFGARATEGIAHRKSPLAVVPTVERLTKLIGAAGATLFAVVDHSGEAARLGLTLRDTKLMIFGNPTGGTPVMSASPLSAIDLPLKVLVWEDDRGAVWMSYLIPQWLAERHGLTPDLVGPLSAAEKLTGQVAAPAGSAGPVRNRGDADPDR